MIAYLMIGGSLQQQVQSMYTSIMPVRYRVIHTRYRAMTYQTTLVLSKSSTQQRVPGQEEVDFDTVQTPATNDPLFRKVDSESARYWRFKVVSTGSASNIGHLQLGAVLELPYGMKTGFLHAQYADNSKMLTNVTDSGSFSGRSVVSTGVRFSIKQSMVETSWVDANWADLADHIRVKPFIFLWDYTNHPLDARFVWLDGSTPPKIQYNTPLHVGFTLNVRGV